jgi:hypothetical protein
MKAIVKTKREMQGEFGRIVAKMEAPRGTYMNIGGRRSQGACPQ